MLRGAQYAGAATYRTNVVKKTRDPTLLRLPADRERVFASPAEFRAHHANHMNLEEVLPDADER